MVPRVVQSLGLESVCLEVCVKSTCWVEICLRLKFIRVLLFSAMSRKRAHSSLSIRWPSEKKLKLEGENSAVPLVKEFYKEVRSAQKAWLVQEKDLPIPSFVIPDFQATLRGYQAQALSWMLYREGVRRSGLTDTQQDLCSPNSDQYVIVCH